jgi:hypothetical protein
MTQIELILKSFALAFVITKFTPLSWFMEAISPVFSKYNNTKLIFNLTSLLLSCISCCSFWVGMIIGGLWVAVPAYIIAHLYSNLLSHKIDKINFQ